MSTLQLLALKIGGWTIFLCLASNFRCQVQKNQSSSSFGTLELHVRGLKKRPTQNFTLGPNFQHWTLEAKAKISFILQNMGSWSKKIHLASNFWHQKLKTKRNCFCSTYRVSKKIFNWPLLELSSFIIKSSKKAKWNFFWPWLFFMLPSSMLGSSKSSILKSSRRGWGNCFCSGSNFWHWKLEAKQNKLFFGLSWSFQAWSSKVLRKDEQKCFLLGL